MQTRFKNIINCVWRLTLSTRQMDRSGSVILLCGDFRTRLQTEFHGFYVATVYSRVKWYIAFWVVKRNHFLACTSSWFAPLQENLQCFRWSILRGFVYGIVTVIAGSAWTRAKFCYLQSYIILVTTYNSSLDEHIQKKHVHISNFYFEESEWKYLVFVYMNLNYKTWI